MKLSLTYNEGLYTLSCEDLDIVSIGLTIEEVCKSFAEDMQFVIDEYYCEDDENLYKGAKGLKDKLVAFFAQEI